MESPRHEKEGETHEQVKEEYGVRGMRGRPPYGIPKARDERKTPEHLEEEERVRGKRGRPSYGIPKARQSGECPRIPDGGAKRQEGQ